jgi:O-antigen ligase
MGWSAVQREDLAAHTPFLQEKLNHLHNNLLQVAVETGWLGLAAWMAWMATALVVMWRAGRGPSDEVAAGIGLGVWAAFVGLMINGLFEYNFGDTEVLMLMCWLMGLSSALSAGPPRHRAQRSGK